MSLARLLTVLIAAAALLDGVTRLLPRDLFAFRAWEVVRWNSPGNAPYQPNYHYDRPNTFGDLPNLGNLPQYRHYHRELFTTDDWGFRRNPANDRVPAPMRILIIGDSFAAGSGLSDRDTLAAQITETLGVQAYSSAPFPLGPPGIDALIRRFGMQDGWLLYQQYGSEAPPAPAQFSQVVPSAHAPTPWSTWLHQRLKADPAPLQILANRAVRSLQDDRILQNQADKSVVIRRLTNGDSMLSFSVYENNWIYTRAPLPPGMVERATASIASYRWLRDEMARRNLKLAVLFVPHKFEVYRTMMVDVPERPDAPDAYIDMVAAALRAEQIPAIDLTRPFTERARAGLARGEYLYRLDDTHWSPLGVRVAAREIAGALCGAASDASGASGCAASR